jgi:hypothetical protein
MKQKNNKKQESSPREISVIQQEFQQLCTRAGHVQYQIEVLKNELIPLNQKILELNREAGLRNDLDKSITEEAKA